MQPLLIVTGSVTGTAASVGRYLKKSLSRDFDVAINCAPTIKDVAEYRDYKTIFCFSNTGHGELPESLRPFHQELTREHSGLDGVNYWLINLGDRHFTTYGKSGRTLDAALQRCSAHRKADILLLDVFKDIYPAKVSFAWFMKQLEINP
ncbi:MAG: flavodoxin domain-containing protein [Pseudomonadota bacterium]